MLFLSAVTRSQDMGWLKIFLNQFCPQTFETRCTANSRSADTGSEENPSGKQNVEKFHLKHPHIGF